MGPLFLVTGLYFIGLIKIQGMVTERLLKLRGRLNKFSGNMRTFSIGTFLPVLLFIGLAYGFGVDRTLS
jgi:cytochrome c-type biogenesis protein